MLHVFVLLLILAVYRIVSPASMKALEGAITALIFTFGPGTLLWIVSWSFGWGLSYGDSCVLSALFVALPLVVTVFKNS